MPLNDTLTLDLTATPFFQWDSLSAEQCDTTFGIPVDSILVARELPAEVTRPSMFRRHTLQPSHKELVPRVDNESPLWAFALVFLMGAFTCFFCQQRKMHFGDILKAAVDRRVLDRLLRDCNLGRPMQMLPMGLMLVVVLAIPIQQMALPESGITGYLLLTLTLFTAYILRNTVLRMLGNAFEYSQGVATYIASNYLYNLIETIFLLMMLFPFLYLPGGKTPIVVCGTALLSLALVMRIVRGLKLFLTQTGGSRFYLFYYLCIVELVPILVLIRYIL